MSFVTWNDVYTELWKQAAQSRGTVTSAGELPGATSYSTLPEWPRTTGADVIAIASLIDPILNATPLWPGGYGITRLWQTAIIEVEAVAFPRPADEYLRNRAFWSALLAVAAHLSTMGAPVPDEAAWEAVTATLWSPAVAVAYRNAGGPPTRALTAPTFAAMWTIQRAELGKARGLDFQAGSAEDFDGPIEVPRTTNADALQHVAYWGQALVRLQVKVMTGSVPAPDEFEELQEWWHAVTADVDQHARGAKPDEIYRDNVELWRASRALSTALGVLTETPAPYELVEAKPTPTTPPATPRPAPIKPKPIDLSSRLNEAADNALTAIAHVINDASDRLVATVGRPLLISGLTIGALLLVLRGTAPCECNCEPAPEPAEPAEAGIR